MTAWHKQILALEKEHGDTRVVAFKKRRRFRRRCEHNGFDAAFSKDTGATSQVINAIRHAIYCAEQCAEYGLDQTAKCGYFDHFIKDRLPTRYAFLKPRGYEIAALPF